MHCFIPVCELVNVRREYFCFEELLIQALEGLTQALQKPASMLEDACALVASKVYCPGE